MGKFGFIAETEETTKWPLAVGAVAVAALVAGWTAWPEEVGSLFKEAKELFSSKSHKEQVASAQGSTNTACNGFIVVNCSAEHRVNQSKTPDKTQEAPVDVHASPPIVLPFAPTIAGDDFSSQKQKSAAKPKPKGPAPHAPNAFARSNVPVYRSIGPNDDLSLLGLDRFKPSLNLCGLKKQLPCYMPPGFGAEIVVRERD